MDRIEGSCLCGGVAFEAAGPLGPIGHCHCGTCRKAHSAAFSTTAVVAKAGFRWLRGEALLGRYESTPGKKRSFCTRCGTQLVAAWDDRDDVILRVGAIDSDFGARPLAHIWTEEKASWYEIGDALPQLPRGVPRP